MIRVMAVRAAAIIALVQGIVHAVTFAAAKPGSIEEAIVLTTMKGSHFVIGGMRRSYWDLYYGYGMMAAGTVVFEAILLWLLANAAAKSEAAVRPVLWLIVAANVAHAAALLWFFFPLPAVFDALVALALVAALVGKPARA